MHSTTSRWPYVVFSFLAILAIRCASAVDNQVPVLDLLGLCDTYDQPNPIAAIYPNNATGVLNGTISIVPIPIDQARKIIPSQYRILEGAMRDQLPNLPQGMYPLVVQAVHDHGISAFGYKIPDFTRAGVEFPFLDLLGDNTTSFKWVPSLLLTGAHEIAVMGAEKYGTNTIRSFFEPSCDAYQAVPNAEPGTTAFGAKSILANKASIIMRQSLTTDSPYPLSFFKNITNQPIFADGKTCDQQIRLFNTRLTTSPFKIDTVKGSVSAKIPPFDGKQQWNNVYGIRLATAFIENNYLPCEQFRGYDGAHIE